MAISREVKVGGFVLLGLIALALVVFLIGEERQLFQSKDQYQAQFQDVEGLRRGSEVRMGGVTVGSVDEVRYGEDPKDTTVYVTLGVVRNEARRIRTDSVVRVVPKGMLGDKMVSISVGSPGKPPIPPGGVIPSEPGQDFAEALTRLGGMTVKAEQTLDNLERATGVWAEEGVREDIRGSVASMGRILQQVDQGEGYATRLLRDPNESQRISELLTAVQRSTATLEQTLGEVQKVVEQIRTGPGSAHDILYGKDAAKAVTQIGGAAEELERTMRGIREGDGLAKALIYGGEEGRDLIANLTELSGTLNRIAGDVRDGKGTVGALLNDPSVYEDLKVLLGNVGRNKALRALVRYSIKQDEEQLETVKDPKQPPPARAPDLDASSQNPPPSN